MNRSKVNDKRSWLRWARAGAVEHAGTGLRDLTWKQYRRLFNCLPIVNPTHSDMARLCPHLTREEAIAAFTSGTGYVALPPVRVKNAFQIVSYHAGYTNDRGEKYPPRLSWSYSSRTDGSHPYKHMQKAVTYAANHWGDTLVQDSWSYVMDIVLQDPTRLVRGPFSANADQPKRVRTICLAMSRRLDSIWNQSNPPMPDSQLIDQAIIELTTDPLVARELEGGRGGGTQFNCAHCGGGLSLSGCTVCLHRFRDDQFRCGWRTPLPQTVIDLLRSQGHTFGQDPSIAVMRELEQFQRAS